MHLSRLMQLGLILLSVQLLIAQKPTRSPVYDGYWWNNVPSDQRVQFLAGYMDCAASDFRDKSMPAISWYTLEPEIDDFYSKHPAQQAEPVSRALLRFNAQKPPSVKGGEHWTDKHGFFDGDYYYGGRPQERTGFIQGYLDCRRSHGQPYPEHAAEWYVAQIDKWYEGKSASQNKLDPRRDKAKIADVLALFAQQPVLPKR